MSNETRRRIIWPIIALTLACVGLMGWVGYLLFEAAQKQESASSNAQTLAIEIKQQCDAGIKLLVDNRDLCQKAEAVSERPAEPVAGPPGPPGIGITNTAVVAGELVVSYSDGQRKNVGTVVGPKGADGLPGRGIRDTSIVGSALVVTFTDGRSENLGVVVGRNGIDGKDGLAANGQDGKDGSPGRGISAVSTVDGQLIVTFTDGTTENAGQLPVGPKGETGARGEPGADSTVPGPAGQDGQPGRGITSVACANDGTWMFSFTDGTTQAVEGPCRAVPGAPAPQPPVTP